jgi:cysteine desulfurase
VPIYLDCNATTPMEPEVLDLVVHYMREEFGNAGSRTHAFGARALQAVQRARDQVASVVGCNRDEVVFTSGATEGNNLAILGLARHAMSQGRRHIVASSIEHKAVIEPIEHLVSQGFEVSWVPPDADGRVKSDAMMAAVRPDTILVSLMHVNNETGVIQPVEALATALADHPAYLHVDGTQGFGRDLAPLRHPRVDLIAVSSHKIFGPKGIGALVTKRRKHRAPPLTPLMFGGGQERGLRPGTLPVPLIAGFGHAAQLALDKHGERERIVWRKRDELLRGLSSLRPQFNGNPELTLPTVVNCSFPGVDSEALMVTLKDSIAVSNGSACTSHSYSRSHVLSAMGLPEQRIDSAVRISWCHLSGDVDWPVIAASIAALGHRDHEG